MAYSSKFVSQPKRSNAAHGPPQLAAGAILPGYCPLAIQTQLHVLQTCKSILRLLTSGFENRFSWPSTTKTFAQLLWLLPIDNQGQHRSWPRKMACVFVGSGGDACLSWSFSSKVTRACSMNESSHRKLIENNIETEEHRKLQSQRGNDKWKRLHSNLFARRGFVATS